MGIYRHPKEFERKLQGYDPLLSIHWGDKGQEWRVERKITHAKPVDPELFSDYDDYQTAKRGNCLILTVPHGRMDERVILTLWAGDMHRRGGAEKIADQMDDAYTSQLAASRAKWLDIIDYASRDAYSYANTVRTVPEAMPHTAPKGGMSIN